MSKKNTAKFEVTEKGLFDKYDNPIPVGRVINVQLPLAAKFVNKGSLLKPKVLAVNPESEEPVTNEEQEPEQDPESKK